MAAPGAPPPRGAKSKGFGDWLEDHRTQAILGAVGATVALALYVKSKNAASSSSGTATTSSTVPTTTADTTQSDAFNGIEDQVLGLQSALLAVQSGAGAQAPSTGSMNPGGTMTPAPSTVPSVASSPALQPGAATFEGYTLLPPDQAAAVVAANQRAANSGQGEPAVGSPGYNTLVAANNAQDLGSAAGILGFTGPLTPAQAEQVVQTAAI